jgi:hypothetical protein
MVSSGMLCRVTLVRTDVSKEPGASFIRVTRIGEQGTTQAATSNQRTFLRSIRRLLVAACVVPSSPILVTLMKEAPGSFETSVLTRVTRHNIPEDTILHSLPFYSQYVFSILLLWLRTWTSVKQIHIYMMYILDEDLNCII